MASSLMLLVLVKPDPHPWCLLSIFLLVCGVVLGGVHSHYTDSPHSGFTNIKASIGQGLAPGGRVWSAMQ